MKNILIAIIFIISSCNQPVNISEYEENLKIVKKAMSCFETPTDFETYKALIHKDVIHQSPMYGQGIVDYDAVVAQAQFYMNEFTNVTFVDPVWLPGADEETLIPDGSVRVYGTWRGESIETGKPFAVDSYHYFDITDGLISLSGDYFDATGMVMAVSDTTQSN